MLDGVLLDWEGVLADTGETRRDCLLRALADEGVHFDATAYDACCRGQSVHVAATAAVGSARGGADPTLVDLVALRATRDFTGRIGQGFSLRPGARDFVERAQIRAPVLIVTVAGRAETELALQLAGLLDACTAIVTADEVDDVVPSPAMFEVALTQLARRGPVRRDRVPVLAHAQPAIRAAREAVLRSVAVAAPAHVALEADGACDSLAEIGMDELAILAGVPGGGVS